jgi:hypothetical protein
LSTAIWILTPLIFFPPSHDLRHAFAVASLIDDPDCIYRLSEHLGHTLVSTTEIYTGHLRRNGAMWRYCRDATLFGSLATPVNPPLAQLIHAEGRKHTNAVP